MDPVANFINNQSPPDIVAVRNFCAQNKIRLSLFSGHPSVYSHLRKYRKFRTYGFEELLDNNIIDSDELDSYGMSLIENVIVHDEVEFFKCLLRKNYPLDARLCKAGTRGIGKLLNYKPGRSQPSLATYCLSCQQRGYYDPIRLEDYFYDAANTTSEESSDGEELTGTQDPWELN